MAADEADELSGRRLATASQDELLQNTRIRNQSMIAQNAPGAPWQWD